MKPVNNLIFVKPQGEAQPVSIARHYLSRFRPNLVNPFVITIIHGEKHYDIIEYFDLIVSFTKKDGFHLKMNNSPGVVDLHKENQMCFSSLQDAIDQIQEWSPDTDRLGHICEIVSKDQISCLKVHCAWGYSTNDKKFQFLKNQYVAASTTLLGGQKLDAVPIDSRYEKAVENYLEIGKMKFSKPS